MSNTGMDIQFDMPKNRSNVIKVIGVGGGGSNAINHMFQQGITGVDFVVCNTDSQALENSPVPIKVQLGVNLTEGLGAGANPEVGEQAALESFEELKNLLDTNTKMVFITAGMGGGTGTGAAPIIAKQAQDMDILTVGIVTLPFKFEGKVRLQQARLGIEKLRNNVDSLIVIDNNKLREVYGNLGFKSGFSKADEVLATASRGIAEVITHHYTQNIDLRDAKTVLSNSGTAIMGSATATGGNRAQEAIERALDSPLLNDNKITGAKNVLLLIVSGTEEITLDEIGEINDHIQNEAGHSANIIMGVGEDEDLGESVCVTIIATGFDANQQADITQTESKKIIHTLEDEQRASHNFSPLNSAISSVSRTDFSAPVQEDTLKHSLQDEEPVEKNQNEAKTSDLISTTPFIKDIDVNYQEVGFEEEDFVFIDMDESDDTNSADDNPSVGDVEEETMFKFDMPKPARPALNKQPSNSSSTHSAGKNITTNSSLNSTSQSSEQHIEVENQVGLFPEQQKTKRYSLEDYLEKERELTNAKPAENPNEPKLVHTPKETPAKQPQKPQTVQTEEVEEIDPLNSPISQQLAARASERRARMKKFNYKFRKSSNIDEIEKQPAYKRAGIDLGQGVKHDNDISRSSINGEGDDLEIRSNNSFLHDNVD